jgi:hypothetical protein
MTVAPRRVQTPGATSAARRRDDSGVRVNITARGGTSAAMTSDVFLPMIAPEAGAGRGRHRRVEGWFHSRHAGIQSAHGHNDLPLVTG